MTDKLGKSLSWIARALVSSLGVYLSILYIVDYSLHKPEVIETANKPLITLYQQWILAPIAYVIRHSTELFGSVRIVQLVQTAESLDVFASAVTAVVWAAVLYGSAIGFLKLYERATTIHTLQEFVVFLLTIASLPLAALGIIHVIKVRWHIELLPIGEDIVEDYRFIVHSAVEPLYRLPFHFLALSVPSWLKDLAVISIVSVGMNRKAWLLRNAGRFDVEWDSFWNWIGGYGDWVRKFFEVKNVFDAIELIPGVFALSVAYILGGLTYLVFFGWEWFAERVASTTYVVIRGITLIGLVYALDNAWEYFRRADEEDKAAIARHRAAKRYGLFAIITAGTVIWFFWALRAGARLV